MAVRRLMPAAIVLLAVLAVAEAIWLWQLVSAGSRASFDIRATNAGVELGPSDGRVFVHASGRAGEVVAEGGLEEVLSVAPGIYDLKVLFARSRDQQSTWIRDVAVQAGERLTRTVEFASGELNVEVSFGASSGQVTVYVFEQGDHDRVVTSMPPGEPVLIAPGTYDVRIVLTRDSLEKDVRWRESVPVKPGLQTRVRDAFERGALLVTAHNAGRMLPDGAVDVAVYGAGDQDRALLESGVAGSTIELPVGRYDVEATFTASSDRPARWLRDVAVHEDETHERRVDFASGTVVVSASMVGGDALDDYQAYVYYYRAGDHEQPVAYAPAHSPVVLESGRYDVRVSFYRSHDRPDLWVRDLRVPAGERVERAVEFASGRLLVRAFDPSGNEIIGDNVFVHAHSAGERTRPVAVARSGEELVLSAGRYDVLAVDTRSPGSGIWLENLRLQAGGVAEHEVTFE